MQQPVTILSRLILSAVLLVGSPLVTALEIEPGVGAGLLYTDNARLTADDEKDDLLVVGYIGAKINENSGRLRLDAEADLIHLHYTRNTFSDENYPGLRLTGGYEQVRGRIDWQVQNYFSQTLVDSDDGVTPENIQNTNIFTIGPTIRFPVSGRQIVTVNPQYRNFYYEDDDVNNEDNNQQQYALSANWFYGMYPTMGVSLNGGVTKVVYDAGDGDNDYTRTTAQAGLSGTRTRSVYSMRLGGTHISPDKSGSTSGFSGNLNWLYNLTGHSSVRIFASSDLTDTGNLLLGSQTNPDDGDFSNAQNSNETLRSTIARLTYRREDATLNTEIWGQLLDLDYDGQGGQGGQSDRDIRGIGVSIGYRVTAALSTGISGIFNRTKETDTDRRDEYYSITGTVGYQLTRKLRTKFDVRYQNQDSKGGLGSEYNEFSSFVRLVYGFATVKRPLRR